jgi:hypothetical protein
MARKAQWNNKNRGERGSYKNNNKYNNAPYKRCSGGDQCPASKNGQCTFWHPARDETDCGHGKGCWTRNCKYGHSPQERQQMRKNGGCLNQPPTRGDGNPLRNRNNNGGYGGGNPYNPSHNRRPSQKEWDTVQSRLANAQQKRNNRATPNTNAAMVELMTLRTQTLMEQATAAKNELDAARAILSGDQTQSDEHTNTGQSQCPWQT